MGGDFKINSLTTHQIKLSRTRSIIGFNMSIIQ